MSAVAKAVFLSYASQDAEAARRICETLRTAGVEVWFDADGGLEHGDEWDAKIRRQIKECVLFIPIISANTQARLEGYFRIEWDLAAERARGIAAGVPFILPVVIDDTREPDALVPDRFRMVQWTRLPGGAVTPDVTARLLKLWSHRVGLLKSQAADSPLSNPESPRAKDHGATPTSPKRTTAAMRWTVAAVAVAALIAVSRPWRWLTPPAANEESQKFAGRSSQLAGHAGFETREQLTVAIEAARRATEQSPDSAQAWATRARLESQFIRRGWDITEKRRQETQAAANRALAMDPNSTDAMYALAVVLMRQQAYTQVEALMRRAIERDPNDAELRSALGGALSGQGREAEALAFRQETLRLFPKNALAHYDLALNYEAASTPDFDAALQKFEDSLALRRFTSTVLHKAALLAGWKGDLPAARQVLDSLDPLERAGDRAVGIAMIVGLLERKPARAIEAAGLTAGSYFDDDYVRGPKAWLLAHAYAMDGKPALALGQWREAETVLRQRLRATPGNWFDEAGLAVTLAWLGSTDEAARIMAPLESIARESPQLLRTVYLAYYHAGCGDVPKAVAALKSVVNRRELLTHRTLPLDPWWEKLRGKPEFEALIKTPGAAAGDKTSASRSAPDKSVAVLPFTNLSDDKANEIFSDGISEELINVLGRVPGLTVKGRTSSFYFKGRPVPMAELAQQLGVAYVIQGSVRKEGNLVRITAQLSRAATDELVWSSEPFQRELTKVWAVQEEIAGLIAQNLSLKLGATMQPARAVNSQAHRLVLEGRHFLAQRDAGFAQAERAFVEALKINPDFAEGHAGLAAVHVVQASYLWADDPTLDDKLRRGRASAHRAMALNASLGPAHTALAYEALLSGRLAESEQHFQRALALNPNDAQARSWHGHLLARLGRLDGALAANEQAVQIDPLSFSTLTVYARQLTYARQHAKALEMVRRALAIRSDFAWSRGVEALNLLALGRADEAVAIALANRAVGQAGLAYGPLLHVLHQANRRREAADYFAEIQRSGTVSGSTEARLLVALGQVEDMLSGRVKLTSGPFDAAAYFWDPVWDDARRDPRFRQRMADLGFAEEYDLAQATLARLRAGEPRR